jgi:hypothetical protein|tara:strand:- start:1257 stop:1571 length:315 start_codon:yes stop_codon:yes gene_type:complete
MALGGISTIAKGTKALRKIRTLKNVPKKLSSMDRAASAYKRKEFLETTPRYMDGRPIPQLESVDKLKGNLMRGLKKFSDIKAPPKITTKAKLPEEDLFTRRPIE